MRKTYAISMVAVVGLSCVLALGVLRFLSSPEPQHEELEIAGSVATHDLRDQGGIGHRDEAPLPDVVQPLPDDPKQEPDESLRCANEQELFDLHLKIAPLPVQKMALSYYDGLVKHYGELASNQAQMDVSLKSILDRADAGFMLRLSEACCRSLRQCKGMIVVDGLDYGKRIEGKKWNLWGGGLSKFNRSISVLIVLDEADPAVEEADREYWNVRVVAIAEALTPFNSKNYSDRVREIEDYLRERRAGNVKGDRFGLPWKWLQFTTIDLEGAHVYPLER